MILVSKASSRAGEFKGAAIKNLKSRNLKVTQKCEIFK